MEKVFIIEDSVVQAHALKKILEPQYEVHICLDSSSGVRQAEELLPSLILLDVIMPTLDGFEVLGRLRQSREIQDIPVILITSLSDVGNEEHGLTMGAVDYIVKPFNAGIVRARVRTHIDLYTYRRAAEQMARVDSLTGIFNRRYADERCQEEWYRVMRRRDPISVGMLDIDFFKQYNDRYGHPAGDGVLRCVAQEVKSLLRRSGEFAARCGGEEFLFVLAEGSAAAGAELAERIRASIENLGVPHEGSAVSQNLTVSVGGLTYVPRVGDELAPFLEQVDRMLYRAKAGGRNRVSWAEIGLRNTGQNGAP